MAKAWAERCDADEEALTTKTSSPQAMAGQDAEEGPGGDNNARVYSSTLFQQENEIVFN